MRKFLLCVIIGSLFTACTREYKNLAYDFPESANLELIDSIDLEKIGILNPHEIQYKDSFLAFRSLQGDRELQLLDLKTDDVYTHHVVGQGANEMAGYVFMNTNASHSVRFVDYYGGKIYEINLDGVRMDRQVKHVLVYSLPVKDEIQILDFEETNDCIYGTGLLPGNRFWVYDKRTKTVTKEVDYPDIEQVSVLTPIQKSVLFSSTIMGANENHLVVSIAGSGLVDFYEKAGDGTLKNKSEHCYFFPKFQVTENGLSIAYYRDNIRGFSDMASDEDYVYLLYSSKTMEESGEDAYNCEDLYVYDWDGNPVRHYVLSQPLYSISIGNGCLYGLSRTGEPKVYIYSLCE